MIDFSARPLAGKKGVVLGIANEHSIAYGCAQAFRGLGADVALTFSGENAKPHVEPLAKALEAPIFLQCDVRVPEQLENVFSRLFGNSADEYLKVHRRSRSDADVTEGSGGIWERLHYDWSDPNRVVLTTTDSNVWGGASGHTYTFTRQANGTTDIDVVIVRDGKNLKGRVLGFVLGTVGKYVLKRAFENSVRAIEARNNSAYRANNSASRSAA
jgi:NAD(P)-dependent dehydrogenase (short-subunit alcohol dehydrogenase family)